MRLTESARRDPIRGLSRVSSLPKEDEMSQAGPEANRSYLIKDWTGEHGEMI